MRLVRDLLSHTLLSSWRPPSTVGGLAAAAAAIAVTAPAEADAPLLWDSCCAGYDAPPHPLLTAGSTGSLRLVRGSFSWSQAGGPAVALIASGAPITHRKLRLERGATLRLDLLRPAMSLSAKVVPRRGYGSREEKRSRAASFVAGDGNRVVWTAPLPRHAARRGVLRVFVRYAEGDAVFAGQLRVRRSPEEP